MSWRTVIGAIVAAGFVFLPSAVLLYFTFAVWLDKERGSLSEFRRNIFRGALLASIVAILLLIAGLVRYDVTREPANTVWRISNGAAMLAWAVGLMGAFFGTRNGRVLLVMTQVATFLSALFFMMGTVAD
jgi:hypothetical protein